jgi:hypothetical protein
MSKHPPQLEKQVHKDHTVIVPPNELRERALVKSRNGQQEIEELITRGNRALESLAPSFAEWMTNEMHRLFEAVAAFEHSDRGPEAAKTFFVVVHDVRGQALQFGYPLAARLAGDLCNLLERQEDLGLPPVIIRSYVEAIASIVRTGVRDEAHALAKELATTLTRVVSDYRARLAEGKIPVLRD